MKTLTGEGSGHIGGPVVTLPPELIQGQLEADESILEQREDGLCSSGLGFVEADKQFLYLQRVRDEPKTDRQLFFLGRVGGFIRYNSIEVGL